VRWDRFGGFPGSHEQKAVSNSTWEPGICPTCAQQFLPRHKCRGLRAMEIPYRYKRLFRMTIEPQISERERENFPVVAMGGTNQQIANQLNISVNTVKVHLRNIFGKIGVASRTEATMYAVRAGIVDIGVDNGAAGAPGGAAVAAPAPPPEAVTTAPL